VAVIGYYFGKKKGELTCDLVFLSILSAIFFILLLSARRFIEFWVPISMLLAAAMLGRLPRGAGVRLHFSYAGVFFVCLFGVQSLLVTGQAVRMSADVHRYSEAAEWLKRNTVKGEMVFLGHWDDFSPMFFFNVWNSYPVGLDMSYLWFADHRRAELYHQITHGGVDDVGGLIRDKFECRFVFALKSNQPLVQKLLADKKLHLTYEDWSSIIMEVR
jgi:hypothetical protein